MDTAKLKKTLLMSIPYLFAAWAGNKISISARFTEGKGADGKLLSFMDHFGQAMSNPLPSLHPVDLLCGALIGLAFFGIMQYKRATAKKMRSGREHGSARWASADEAQMLRAKQFCDNMIITATLWMTMKKPKTVKLARNHNVCIIGSSGTGKTRFYLKPNLMQMFGSYVVTDPKGTILIECGKMLQRGRPMRDEKGKMLKDKDGRTVYEPYHIKVFNTVDFSRSMHYNPMAYAISDSTAL